MLSCALFPLYVFDSVDIPTLVSTKMGASDGTASPTESRDGSSNAKKRSFGQQPGENNCNNSNGGSSNSGGGQMVVSSAESLVALETGLLKLERENCHQHGAGHLHFQLSHEIDARMPLRSRLQELATFVAWFALIASCTMQYPMVWVAFWNHVQALRVRMGSFHRRTVALPLWGLWVAALFCYRRTIYRRVAPDLGALFMHAEVFACVVLVMTGEAETWRIPSARSLSLPMSTLATSFWCCADFFCSVEDCCLYMYSQRSTVTVQTVLKEACKFFSGEKTSQVDCCAPARQFQTGSRRLLHPICVNKPTLYDWSIECTPTLYPSAIPTRQIVSPAVLGSRQHR